MSESLYQPLTKRIVLIDVNLIDPRLYRRRVILDSFNDDPLTKEQAHELYTELAEIETSLQSDSLETETQYPAKWIEAAKSGEIFRPGWVCNLKRLEFYNQHVAQLSRDYNKLFEEK